MLKRIQQALCIHWFDAIETMQFSQSSGPIICTEQKTWTITEERRTCSKCDLVDRREIGEPVYEGWT